LRWALSRPASPYFKTSLAKQNSRRYEPRLCSALPRRPSPIFALRASLARGTVADGESVSRNNHCPNYAATGCQRPPYLAGVSPFIKPRFPAIERAAQFVATACPLQQAEAQRLRLITWLANSQRSS